ncbi:hypothetical protein Adt_26438 [Abeliophyllum distichum]|uniref:Uncharacterized protein n=1 Tax=Abeliophyllum distichum TaxID=126358 RepID=A0ABD1RQV9_9LAMI
MARGSAGFASMARRICAEIRRAPDLAHPMRSADRAHQRSGERAGSAQRSDKRLIWRTHAHHRSGAPDLWLAHRICAEIRRRSSGCTSARSPESVLTDHLVQQVWCTRSA